MPRNYLKNVYIQYLSELPDAQLVDKILAYFNRNKTLPRERSLREYALSLKEEFADGSMTALLPEAKMDMAAAFADVAVKETKLTGVEADVETLPLVLSDIQHIFPNTFRNIFSVPVTVEGQEVYTTDGHTLIGHLKAGFYSNFKDSLRKGFVLATDHSNGKFKNMSYSLLVNLSDPDMINVQTLAAWSKATQSCVS